MVTGRSRGEVDEALGSDIMKAFALNWPAEVWARHGASHPMGDDFTGVQDIIPQTLDEQTVLSYTSDGPAVAAERGHAHRHTRRGHRSGCGVARPRPALCGDGRCQRGAAKPAPRLGRQRALREDSSWTSQAINRVTKESVAASGPTDSAVNERPIHDGPSRHGYSETKY